MSPDDDLEGRARAAVAAAIDVSGRKDAEIARALGVSRAMVGNYRREKNTITLGTAVALARTLGITVDQLAGAEPLPEPAVAPLPTVIVDGVEYAPASALDAGAASRAAARAALREGDEVALDAEEAARLGRQKDAQKRRRSA